MSPPPQRSGDRPPAGNYLYLSRDPPTERSCFESFERVDPVETSLVVVTRSPDETLQRWLRAHAEPPADANVVSISDRARSAASGDSTAGTPTSDVIWTVSHPGDLTGIGIAVSEIVAEQTNPDLRLVVCFDALDAVLQYAPLKPAYRFLHQLTTRLGRAEALAHFHVARYQFDGGPGSRIEPLFDGVIEPGTEERSTETP